MNTDTSRRGLLHMAKMSAVFLVGIKLYAGRADDN